jgi:hypothetical protein
MPLFSFIFYILCVNGSQLQLGLIIGLQGNSLHIHIRKIALFRSKFCPAFEVYPAAESLYIQHEVLPAHTAFCLSASLKQRHEQNKPTEKLYILHYFSSFDLFDSVNFQQLKIKGTV